ncbi:ABC transporter ATP-binding protein [Thermophilibacter provencensis]|uniref:ABC transporter ATP-binding protein n=1 Tax=Thermophilibacter provencensis TaxID=1852386 RepID=UPI00094AD335|nr:ABC transporter ATP-binding protein [Thermophilibacter provencensis]
MSETNVSVNAELRDVAEEVTEQALDQAARAEVLLDVRDLSVTLFTEDGALPAIRSLSFVMRRGETLAVVGESGCGKSMTALSIMGLLPQPPAKIVGGKILLEGADLAALTRDEMRTYRGSKIGMIFQEPMTSLNPVMTAGRQIREGILVHNPKMPKKDADARALEMIKLVGIPAPEKVFRSYPHELSGGMRQRVMIAMALACQPSLLICDEPTTALDVTIQAQILQLIDRMREELGTAVMLITHDMGVVSEMADWVAVMYAGHLVEYTLASELFTNPKHPYSIGLINSIPSLDDAVEKLYAIPGNVPMLDELPTGCPFHPRCPYAKDVCRSECPHVAPLDGNENHTVACWMFDSEKWGE